MTPEQIKILLSLLLAILPVVGALLTNAFDKKKPVSENLLVIGLAVVSAVLTLYVGVLSSTPTNQQNTDWIQKVLWTLSIGYSFSLVTVLYLFRNRHDYNLEKTSDDWRQALLRVMESYVKQRLRDSLHDDKIIQVSQERRSQNQLTLNDNYLSQSNQFIQPQRLLTLLNRRNTFLDPGQPIIETFEEEADERLMILGAPGSGKTTLLLELAQSLIKNAKDDPNKPIPMLFELSSWDDKQTIGNWLIADLKSRYNVPEKISSQWLEKSQLIPLLDGLDELGLSGQEKCIEQINEFLKEKYNLPLAVCCREEEYDECGVKLGQLRGTVFLQPLKADQIKDYLRQVMGRNSEWWKIWQLIQNDPNGLGELAKTPLFLHLIPIAYLGGLPQNKYLNPRNQPQAYQNERRKDLFDAYIKKCLESKKSENKHNPWKDEYTKKWLKWLAEILSCQNRKDFFIEKIQPDYLKNNGHRKLYRLIVGIISGLMIGLISGLVTGSISGLVIGAISGLFFSFSDEIQPNNNLELSFDIVGVIIGLIFAITISLTFELSVGLIIGVVVCRCFQIIIKQINQINLGIINISLDKVINSSYLNKRIILPKINKLKINSYPNQGIKESAKYTVIVAIIFLPISMLFMTSFLYDQGITVSQSKIIITGLSFGLFFGIIFAGIPVIQHFALRLILWRNGSIPWNYAYFLSYADKLKLIQQVGGRYHFIHDLLQEHFANM